VAKIIRTQVFSPAKQLHLGRHCSKHLGDIATVLLDLVCLSLFTHFFLPINGKINDLKKKKIACQNTGTSQNI